ncbi:hypothetical protein E2R68_10605 [Psychromonas sp. RZ22]|uniref:hypothetical protein n=1 Tax=Psychromonas algarum TaxID=2555643 RepID=UPI001068A324|nr:hypothetical protein [Psychromonas sp. RZ22]TEW53930.1 hypothetical protein E2R68_10605 [Psychromonas sp. RZ22]
MPINKISTVTDTPRLINLLGITENTKEAGFILSDGRLLHLPRKNPLVNFNHLDVIKLLPQFQMTTNPVSDTEMIAFMAKEQLIRFNIEGIIHCAVHPSSMQMRKIYNILAYRSSIFEIIISNAAAMTLAQHQVSGPSMSTLVKIFKIYEQQTAAIKTDEFFVQQTATHYQLVFRPSMKVVGKMNKNTNTLKMELEYKSASKLFYQLITDL